MQNLNISQGDYVLSLSQEEFRLLLTAVDTKIDTCQELGLTHQYFAFADLREQLYKLLDL